ncbi:HAD family hydrolase [Chloroflexi bacterium TSY]|nr:HAD family hydrolase [Chloroflexi bacterium TSY]
MKANTDTILFDLDGTLVHHGHLLMPELLRSWGIVRNIDQVEEAVQAQINWIYEATKEDRGTWSIGNMMEFYRRILSALDIPDPTGELVQKSTEFFNAQPVPPLFDDVLPLFEKLEEASWQMGVITQRSRLGAERFLEAHGLHMQIKTIIAGDDGFGRKPEVGPFHAALNQLTRQPEQAIFVGDRIDDDCDGALGAGLSAFLIDRRGIHQSTIQQRDDIVHLRSLLDLLDYLGRENDEYTLC